MPTFISDNQHPNTGWLFYKKYYSPNVQITDINNSIFSTVLLEIPALSYNSNYNFKLETTYPGLTIGTGYNHEVKDENDAFKLGFFFDYTSGMPLIPGSTVKGLLRSAFPQRVVLPQKKTLYQLEKDEWIKRIINEKCEIHSEIDVNGLEQEIFDGLVTKLNSSNSEHIDKEPVSVYERDIFFDAVPVEITVNNIGQNRRLLGSDYITPHKNKNRDRAELDPFSEPNPLMFLKILPKVKIEFRFKLVDSITIPQLNAQKKLVLFKEIIKILGIGAKTNVGYGQFE